MEDNNFTQSVNIQLQALNQSKITKLVNSAKGNKSLTNGSNVLNFLTGKTITIKSLLAASANLISNNGVPFFKQVLSSSGLIVVVFWDSNQSVKNNNNYRGIMQKCYQQI
eukprot:TRINITY_DN2468_c1_g5_i3.p1 TRINITY_DN2468_c1_g5~~TRINITY_DN2468_c1_g5_i3.p1  ORF type:complete len:110 (-),score=17.83 TRINITY_DN2468_c1_g5_i3:45-374(-)